MGGVRVRYLVIKANRDGARYYWQPSAKLIRCGFATCRLSDDLPTAIAEAEKLNAELDAWYTGQGPEPIRPGTVKALSNAWQRDPGFRALAPRSQAEHVYHLRGIEEWAGRFPVRALTRKAIRAWLGAQEAERGRYHVYHAAATLRRLLSYAHDEGEIDVHPALKLRVGAPDSRRQTWTDAQVDALCAAAHKAGLASVALAARAMWALAQRPNDVLTLPLAAWDGQRIGLRQSKTGAVVTIKPLPELRAELERRPRGDSLALIVCERTGRPWRLNHFQKAFAKLRDKAGLPSTLQARDLRRTGATNLGRAGCTDDELRAITGHRTRGVVGVYVLPDSRYADAAIAKLGRHRKANKAGAKLDAPSVGQLDGVGRAKQKSI